MKPIKVVDSIMGSGKTSWAIQTMKENPGPWLYVTPYLAEIDRIVGNDGCPPACPGFMKPTDEQGTKTDDLKRLLLAGENIATTHELFKRLDPEAISLIQAGGYCLIMDEVLDVIQPVPLRGESIQALLRREVLVVVDEEGKTVKKVLPGPESDLDEYDLLRTWAAEGRLVLVSGKLLFWLFPADVFQAFKEVFNLTYLFDGQYQKAYYDMHGLSYDMHSAGKQNGRWILTEYLPAEQEETIKAGLRPLIEVVYDDRLNLIGEADTALSRNWFNGQSYAVKKLRQAMHNFFINVTRSTTEERLWTCPKAQMEVMANGRYGRSFISSNTRATNEYRERSVVAYCLNAFIKPEVDRFFKDRGVVLDQELYALSEMVQLIWRSRIREWKPIVVFIPSKRMRNLFDGWLNGSLMEEAIVANAWY